MAFELLRAQLNIFPPSVDRLNRKISSLNKSYLDYMEVENSCVSEHGAADATRILSPLSKLRLARRIISGRHH